MPAGGLRDRLLFQQRGADENGDIIAGSGPWEDQFEVWAKLEYQRGSEVAITNRLEGWQPVTIDIRDSQQARRITPGWRAIKRGGLRDGESFNLTAVAPGRELGILNLMGISGKATG